MEESAQASKRALAGLKSHKLNALNGLLTQGAKSRNGHAATQPVPAKRLDVIKAYAADVLPAGDAGAVDAGAADATATQIAQRFAPRPGSIPPPDEDRISAGPLAPPLLALASGVRTLAAALIAVALLPNLVLAGLLWYGAVEPRWPSVAEPQPQYAQTSVVRSVVTTPILLPPPMARDAGDGGDVTAALPLAATAAGEAVKAGPEPVSMPNEPAAETGAPEQGRELAVAAIDETPPASASVAPSAEPVPLPTRRPMPPRADDADASWIKPTAYVNLRAAPSSGASVVAVIAKGTKLRVVTRKRGWVQATDPATEKTGWVYSGNVVAAAR